MNKVHSNYGIPSDIWKNSLIAALFAAPLLMFILLYPEDLMGWIFVVFAFGLLLMSPNLIKKPSALSAAVIVIILHAGVSFINAYIGTTVGAEDDAKKFHAVAKTMAEGDWSFTFGVGSEFYTNVLAFIYKMFGVSHFTGHMTSTFVFVLNILVFLKLMKKFGIIKHQSKLLLLFGALPTVVLNTSIILRESWEILFFLLSMYSAVSFREKRNFSRFVGLISSVGILSLWHNGLVAFAPLFIMISLLWAFSKNEEQGKRSKKGIALFSALFVIIIWFLGTRGGVSSGASLAMLNGDTLHYASEYRENSALGDRAAYGVQFNDPSLMGLIKTLPLMMFYYMFAPLPWQVGNVMDMYAAAESVLRFLLIFYAVKTWRSLTGEERRRHGYMLLLFLSIEMLWSMGTVNWGTAMRHHLVSYGLLLLLGGPMLLSKLTKRPFSPHFRKVG